MAIKDKVVVPFGGSSPESDALIERELAKFVEKVITNPGVDVTREAVRKNIVADLYGARRVKGTLQDL
jgi:hypothetical protein